MDEESLQNSRSRCRSLDIFLVVSIILCFSMVVAVAVVVIRSVKHEIQLQDRIPENALNYKMQHFAYLRPESSQLTQGTMSFNSIQYGQEDTVGSHFNFDGRQSVLQPKKTGMHFLYVELSLTCTAVCKKGVLTVVVSDLLTCTMSLPESADSVPQAKKCWTVSQIKEGSWLITKMSISESETHLENWKLDLNSSGLGMFLVG